MLGSERKSEVAVSCPGVDRASVIAFPRTLDVAVWNGRMVFEKRLGIADWNQGRTPAIAKR